LGIEFFSHGDNGLGETLIELKLSFERIRSNGVFTEIAPFFHGAIFIIIFLNI